MTGAGGAGGGTLFFLMLPAEPLGGTLLFASLGAPPPAGATLVFFVSCAVALPRGEVALLPGGTLFFLGSADATTPGSGPFFSSLGARPAPAFLSSAAVEAGELAPPEADAALAFDAGPTDFGGSVCS
jgi:hypothetical protein